MLGAYLVLSTGDLHKLYFLFQILPILCILREFYKMYSSNAVNLQNNHAKFRGKIFDEF